MRFLCVFAVLASASVGWAGPARPSPGGAAAQVGKPADLSISEADLAVAVKALATSAGIVAAVRGDVPARRVSLNVRGGSLRQVLDALSALYGVPWRVQVTTFVFQRDRLDQEIDLTLRDADLTTALAEFKRASGIEVRARPSDARGRRVSLALKATPARDVLDAIAALYGLRWLVDEGVPRMSAGLEAGGGARQGVDPRIASLAAALEALMDEKWDVETSPELRAATREMGLCLTERLRALEPGQAVEFAEFTPAEKALAVDIAQRYLAARVLAGFSTGRGPGALAVDPCTLSGAGVAIRKSADGRLAELCLRRMDGRGWPVQTITVDGGPPSSVPPLE